MLKTDNENYIFRPQGDTKQEDIGDEQFHRIVYTIKKHSPTRIEGNAVLLNNEETDSLAQDHQHAYAMSVKFNNSTKYYIKYANGQLLNPLGLYSRDIYKKLGDESTYKWKQVNSKSFKFYIGFLKTKNEAYYRNAERSMI